MGNFDNGRQKRNINGLCQKIKCAAANGRFGAMAAVAPQKRQCKFETLDPAASLVEAATTPSRWDVVGKRGDSAV